MSRVYDWVTDEAFDEKLRKLVEDLSVDSLLAIPGVYEAVKEELNNLVLEALEAERGEED